MQSGELPGGVLAGGRDVPLPPPPLRRGAGNPPDTPRSITPKCEKQTHPLTSKAIGWVGGGRAEPRALCWREDATSPAGC